MSDSTSYYSGVVVVGFKKESDYPVKPKVTPKANVATKTGAVKK